MLMSRLPKGSGLRGGSWREVSAASAAEEVGISGGAVAGDLCVPKGREGGEYIYRCDQFLRLERRHSKTDSVAI